MLYKVIIQTLYSMFIKLTENQIHTEKIFCALQKILLLIKTTLPPLTILDRFSLSSMLNILNLHFSFSCELKFSILVLFEE